MRHQSDLLDRARMTVERTALTLRDLRDELDAAMDLDPRHQHALWDAVTDLEWRHSLLADFHLDMLLSPPSELVARWEQFSIRHDDYREALRELRSQLGQACRGNARPAGTVARQRTTSPGTTGRPDAQA